jgi:hypothetical protein
VHLTKTLSGTSSHKGASPRPTRAAGNNPAIALLTVLGSKPPATVTINEFTTIASVWTHNQFINGTAIKGSPLALRITAGNVPNFVDIATGGYGTTIQDALNSSQTPSMANFATLASLLAGCATQVTTDACAKLFAAAAPQAGAAPADTLAVAEAIARNPGHQADKLFGLLDAFYPVPPGKKMRATPFMPYLSFAPSAWVLPLKFTGGGYSGGGKLMFDSQGNAWVGNNFVVGAQNQSILWNGNLSKFAPNGQPLSPMTTGFSGGGLSGVGFGLAVDAQDTVWASGYASQNIARFSNAGKPLSPPDGWTVDGQLGEMQGIIVTRTGDIWAVDQGKNTVVHLPNGDPAKARVYCEKQKQEPAGQPLRPVRPRFIWLSTTRTASGSATALAPQSFASTFPTRPRSRNSTPASVAVASPSTARAMSGAPTALAVPRLGEPNSTPCWPPSRQG